MGDYMNFVYTDAVAFKNIIGSKVYGKIEQKSR